MVKKWIINVLVAIDQLVNAVLLGDPDMTLSGRMGRAVAERRCRLCRWICAVLDMFDSRHCARQDRNESDEGKDEIARL